MTEAGPLATTPRRPRRAVLAGLGLAAVLAGAVVWRLARPWSQPPPPAGPGVTGRVTVSPASVDFGELMAGSAGSGGRTREVKVRNGLSSALRVARVFVAGDDAPAFAPDATSCTRARVAPGQSCMIRVRFLPTQQGARSGTLSVETGAADGPLTVALTGAATVAALEVDHQRLDFGPQAVGARSAVQAIRILNAGSAPLPLQVLAARSGDPDESSAGGAGTASEFPVVSSGCPMGPADLLAAGQTCTVAIAFEPAAPGGRSATLAIAADPGPGAPGAAGAVSVALSGTGTDAGSPPALVPSAPEVDFGPVVPGAKSPVTTLTVSNASGSRVEVRGVAVRGAGASEFALAGTSCRAGSFLRPGGRCTVSLQFQPSGAAGAGGRSAMVAVDHAEPGGTGAPGPRSLTIALTGRGAVALPAAGRTREDFGTLPLGTATDLRTLVIGNDGAAPLGVGKLVLAGADPGDFVLSADRCSGATVEPGRTCTFAIGFDPRREGGRSATIVVPHDAGGPPVTIALSGAGAVAADLSVAVDAPPDLPGPQEPEGPQGPRGRSGPPGRWRVTVHNAGPRDATGVRLVVSGEAVSLDPSSAGRWRCEAAGTRSGGVVCTLPALSRSGRAVLDIGARIAGEEGVPSLTASVQAAEPDPATGDNKAHALVPLPRPAPTGR